MLTVAAFDSLSVPIVGLYELYSQQVLNDIARRLVKMTMTSTAAWQMQRLVESGMVYQNALKELSKTTGRSEAMLRAQFEKGGVRSVAFDDSVYRAAGLKPLPLNLSPAMLNVLLAGLRKTDGKIKNLTQTSALSAQQVFVDEADMAYMKVTTGVASYDQAIRDAVKNAAGKGLSTVDYASGRTDQLDVAMRRTVLSGVVKTAGELTVARAEDMDCDLVQTGAHAGSRPEHEPWQGKVFSLSGTSKKYPDFVSSTGYGEVDGICGINCRHPFFPFFEGLSENAYTAQDRRDMASQKVTLNGKEVSQYEASQVQRGIERKIRDWKRQANTLEAAGLDNKFEMEKVRAWQARAREFVQETGLDRQGAREGGKATKSVVVPTMPIMAQISESESLYGEKMQALEASIGEFADQHAQVETKGAQERVVIINQRDGQVLVDYVQTMDVNKELNAEVIGGADHSAAMFEDGKWRPDLSLMDIHTHPRDETFSEGDWKLFAGNNPIGEMRVYSPDKVYKLEKTQGFMAMPWQERTPAAIERAYNRIQGEVEEGLKGKGLGEEEWIQKSIDETTRRMAKEFGIEYSVEDRKSAVVAPVDTSSYKIKEDRIVKESEQYLENFNQLPEASIKHIEHAIIVDSNGDIVIEKDGGDSFVSFYKEEMASMLNSTLLHNHPKGGSFSEDDLVMAATTNMKSIKAVGTDEEGNPVVYTMERTGKTWWVNNADEKEQIAGLRYALNGGGEAIRKDLTPLVLDGTLDEDQAGIRHFDLLSQRIANRYGWKYTKEPIVPSEDLVREPVAPPLDADALATVEEGKSAYKKMAAKDLEVATKKTNDGLSENEANVVAGWTGGMFYDYQDVVRGTLSEKISASERKEALAETKKLDKIIVKHGMEAPDGTTAYRGMEVDPEFAEMLKTPGSVFTDKGFTSFTLSREIAGGFAGIGGIGEDETTVGETMESIIIRANLGGVKFLPLGSEEQELLLGRGQSFKVVKYNEKTGVIDVIPI